MTKKNISPWGYFEMDEATGLPLLPEGHTTGESDLRTRAALTLG